MKTKIIFLMMILSVFMMAGCSLSNEIDEETVLLGNSDYEEYKKLINTYKYDENNEYIDKDNDDSQNKVHITFAKNNLLDIDYYLDENRKEIIDTDNCYLSSGDKVYAFPELKNIEQRNYYEVKSFDIYAFDGNNKNKKDTVNKKNVQGVYDVYTVPDNIRNNEISIVPIGRFTTNEISLVDEVNIDNKTVELSENEWIIQIGNKQEKTKKAYFNIDPSSNYTIKYNYDPKKYYFVSSEPEYWRLDREKGSIEFLTEEAYTGSDSYKVLLGENQKFTFTFSENTSKFSISIDDSDYVSIPEAGSDYFAKENTIVKIKSYQTINDNEFTTTNLTKKSVESDGKVWVYEVGNGSGIISLDFSSLKYENGTVKFYDENNKQITGNTEFNINNKQFIRYKAIPDSNYNFCNLINRKTDLEGEIEVNGQLAYHLSNSLKFEKKTEFELEQPDCGGTIEYYKNDELCDPKETTLEYLESDVITAKIIPNSQQGFICKDGQKFKVEFKEGRELFINESTGAKYLIDNLFTESDEHKPNLTVELDKSVGKVFEFNVYTNVKDIGKLGKEINDHGKSYDSGLIKVNKKIIDSKKISTVSGIIFTADKGGIPSDEALRFDVNKKDKDGNKTKSIYYITNIADILTVKLNPNVFYSSVDIVIKRVTVMKFGNYQAFPHSNIKFEYADEEPAQELSKESITEESRKIRMIVTPSDGYVLTGEKIKNGEYVKEGKVEDARKMYNKMMKDVNSEEN